MSKPYSLYFPWLRFLWNSIFWSVVAMCLLTILETLLFPLFDGDPETDLVWSELLTLPFWQSIFGNLAINFMLSIFILIPSFYAGMGACVWLEKRGGHHEKPYETIYRVVATIVFALLALIALWVIWNTGNSLGFNTLQSFNLVIIYYIFDDNVAEAVWPEIFEHRD